MADDYTPTTEQVCEAYVLAVKSMRTDTHPSEEEVRAEFSRWLAQVKTSAEVRGAQNARRDDADELDRLQIWWGDYHQNGRQRYGANVCEVVDPDSVPYPTVRRTGVADWLRGRAGQTNTIPDPDALRTRMAAVAEARGAREATDQIAQTLETDPRSPDSATAAPYTIGGMDRAESITTQREGRLVRELRGLLNRHSLHGEIPCDALDALLDEQAGDDRD